MILSDPRISRTPCFRSSALVRVKFFQEIRFKIIRQKDGIQDSVTRFSVIRIDNTKNSFTRAKKLFQKAKISFSNFMKQL